MWPYMVCGWRSVCSSVFFSSYSLMSVYAMPVQWETSCPKCDTQECLFNKRLDNGGLIFMFSPKMKKIIYSNKMFDKNCSRRHFEVTMMLLLLLLWPLLMMMMMLIYWHGQARAHVCQTNNVSADCVAVVVHCQTRDTCLSKYRGGIWINCS